MYMSVSFEEFIEKLVQRLLVGDKVYGSASFTRPAEEIIREIEEELIDVVGWTYCLLRSIKSNFLAERDPVGSYIDLLIGYTDYGLLPRRPEASEYDEKLRQHLECLLMPVVSEAYRLWRHLKWVWEIRPQP
jgi:hypothetical protein